MSEYHVAMTNIRKFIEMLRHDRSRQRINEQQIQSAKPRRIHAYELESRVLYSAAPIPAEMVEGVDADALGDSHLLGLVNESFPEDLSHEFLEPSADDNPFLGLNESFDSQSTAAQEFVFIDSSVEDFEWMSQQLSQEYPDATVVILDSESNGVEQISEALAEARHVTAVHFISHGSDGNVQLGNTALNQQTIGLFTDQIVQWSHALSLDADLYFYGCNLAGSQDGIELLQSLESITGADLAASDDLTGHESLGGDWDLEYRSGEVSESTAFFQGLQDRWMSLLAAVVQPDSYNTAENSPITGNVLSNDETGGFDLAIAPVLNYDANNDTEDFGGWRDENGNFIARLDLDPSVTHTVNPTNAPNAVDGAFQFNGAGGANFDDIPSVVAGIDDNNSVSFELWFNPSDAVGQEILFDIGNMEGTTLKLNDNQLEFHASDVVLPFPLLTSTLTTTFDLTDEIAANEYIHFVGVLDIDAGGTTMNMFINGQLVDSDNASDFFEWANGSFDGTGLGSAYGSTTVTDSPGADAYVGEMAAFNVYGQALTAAEVQQNFENAYLTVTNFDSVSAGGATVSVDAGGNFSYDPGTAFDYLEQGETTVDTFQYEATDAQGNTSFQNVVVQLTGENDAPTSAIDTVILTGNEDLADLTYDLRSDVTDAEGDTLNAVNFNLVSGDASGVTLSPDSNIVTVNTAAYNHLAADDVEVIEYTYQVADGNGGLFDRSLTVEINGANDVPTFVADIMVSLSEDDPVQTIDLLDGFTDADFELMEVDDIDLLSGDDSGVDIGNDELTIDPNAYNHLGPGETETIVFRYNVQDEDDVSAYRLLTIEITGSNDAPVVGPALVETADETSPAFQVDLLDGASDPEGQSLSVQNLTLVSGDATGITVVGDELTVDPSAYSHLFVGQSETIQFDYEIVDTDGAATNQTMTIVIDGVDLGAPTTAGNLNQTTHEDQSALDIDLLSGASDPDGGSLAVSGLNLLGGDDRGVTISGSTLTLDPSAYNALADGEAETLNYEYSIVDIDGHSVTQTLTVEIQGRNDLPTVPADIVTDFTENDPRFFVNLLGGVSDPDSSDTLSVTGLTLVSGNAVGISPLPNWSLRVDPDAYDYLGAGQLETIVFTFNVDDSNGGQVARTLTLNVTGTNDTPMVTAAINESMTEDAGQLTYDLLEHASDADSGDTLNVANLTLLSGNDVGMSFDAATNSVVIDTSLYDSLNQGDTETVVYRFDVIDSQGESVNQTAIFRITGNNDAPSVSSQITAVRSEDSGSFSVDLLMHATDVDSNAVLSVSNVTHVSGNDSGITLAGNSLDVDPSVYNFLSVGDSETVVFQFDVVDEFGVSTPQQAVIVITGENDDPVVTTTIKGNVEEDGGILELNLLDNVFDIDNLDTLSIANLQMLNGDASGVVLGSETITVDANVYDHLAGGTNEVLTFTYDVVDNHGGIAAGNIAQVTIAGINDDPQVAEELNFSTLEDNKLVVDLLQGASDVDSSLLGVAAVNAVAGDVSGISVSGNQLFVDPAAYQSLQVGDTEKVVVEYLVVDAAGGKTPQTLTVYINGQNDVPQVVTPISDLDVDEDSSIQVIDLSAIFSDVDDDNLTYKVDSLSDPGLVGATIKDGRLFLEFLPDQNGQADITIAAVDSGGRVASTDFEIDVQAVNDRPIVVDQAFAISDSVGVSGNVLDNAVDIDSPSLTAQLTRLPSNGTVTVNPDGSFTFVPNTDFNGTDFFEFVASDGQSLSQTGRVFISVAGSFNVASESESNPVEAESPADEPVDPELKTGETPLVQAESGSGNNSPGGNEPGATLPPEAHSIPVHTIDDLEESEDGFRKTFSGNFLPSSSRILANSYYGRSADNLELPDVMFSNLTTTTAAVVPEAAIQIVTSLNSFSEDLDYATDAVKLSLTTSVVSLSGVSIGVVAWALRSGVLLASMMANLPAWRMVDPLSVLGYVNDDLDDGESLMDIVDGNEQ